MNSEVPSPPPPGLKLDDIYYILFRHKWKIISFAVVGVAAAAIIFFGTPRVYKSEAKLLIRYIVETKNVNPVGATDQVKSPDDRGENIINSEIEILSSFDVARQVVDLVGAEKILSKIGGGKDRDRAALEIGRRLKVEPPRRSNVIRVTFEHPDSSVVQPVLERLVEVYRRKHIEIHRGVGVIDDFLSQQTDQLRSRLSQTEKDLRRVKATVGVISLDDSKKAFVDQLTKLRQDLLTAEAELEERKAAVGDIEKLNLGKASGAATNAAAPAPIPPEQLNEYRDVCAQLNSVQTNRAALLLRFRDDSPMVKQVQEEMVRLEARKKGLEEENPNLLASGISPITATPGGDIAVETSRIRALDARVRFLNSQFQRIRGEVTELDKAEVDIVQLQRQRELEESNLKHYASKLEQARADEALGMGRITNIGIAQAPVPPFRDMSKLTKPAAMALAGGVGFGIGLAFLIELLINQTVRRSSELEGKLQLRLFLSIPNFSGRGRPSGGGVLGRVPGLTKLVPPTLKPQPSSSDGLFVQPSALYFESLRDRLITWFEARKLNHKPKLVAVTSCSKGAGVSTIASGLAASLSETGCGRVLLVDMDHDRAAAHPFLDGKPACALHEALEPQKSETAVVQENFYLASGNGVPDSLPKAMPKRFSHLIPKMKASDYDYIIFDMPPVNQTSITPRLAGHMDIVLMVVEAEKTSREAVRRGVAALAESQAPTAAVMNKIRSYVPGWLRHEEG